MLAYYDEVDLSGLVIMVMSWSFGGWIGCLFWLNVDVCEICGKVLNM